MFFWVGVKARKSNIIGNIERKGSPTHYQLVLLRGLVTCGSELYWAHVFLLFLKEEQGAFIWMSGALYAPYFLSLGYFLEDRVIRLYWMLATDTVEDDGRRGVHAIVKNSRPYRTRTAYSKLLNNYRWFNLKGFDSHSQTHESEASSYLPELFHVEPTIIRTKIRVKIRINSGIMKFLWKSWLKGASLNI